MSKACVWDSGIMNEQKSSFRQIVKSTSLFGGVQVFQIILFIIRSKIIAILLGPAGMGIAGLLTSATSLIAGLTSMGLGTSAVKNISSAHASGDEQRITSLVSVFRRLVWITGLLGAIITLVLSSWLSTITFGNDNYTLAFICLSITLLFNQLSTGQSVLLQGMRQLQYQAKASMSGALFGLLISVPIYYIWRKDGIVPSIIISSILSLCLEWYYGRKIPLKKVRVDFKTVFFEGKDMLQMGFMVNISMLLTALNSYILRIFLSSHGGVAEVGLYSAGFAIITQYFSLVFTAMGTDYYPRLSGLAHNDEKANELINQQSEVAILILSPILTFFLVFINWAIILVYSTKFIPINGMIHWAALGMYFRALSWAIAFIFLAKGESKIFFWTELIGNSCFLLFNIIGYKIGGLEGMGISFLIGYIIYFIQVYIIAKIKYGFYFKLNFYKIFIIQILMGLLCFISVKMLSVPLVYIATLPMIVFSLLYSLKELDRRMDLRQLVSDFKSRFKK
jgi:O-antigen/teichoic acid export membrane protein